MNFRVFNVYYPLRNFAFFLIEASLIFLVILLASAVKVKLLDGTTFSLWSTVPKVTLITVVCVLSLYYHDLYNLGHENKLEVLIVELLHTLGVASLTLASIYFVFPNWIIAEKVFVLALFLIIAAVFSVRLLYSWALQSNKLTEKILLMGTNDLAVSIMDEIRGKPDKAFEIVGILKDPQCLDFPENGIPILGTIDDVLEVTKTVPYERIVVSMTDRRGKLPLRQLLELKLTGKQINDSAEFYEHLTGKIMVERLRPSYLIFSDGFKISKTRKRLKRLMDVVCSLLGLVLFLPIAFLTAIAIKIDSKGPVLYRQERVGEGGQSFVLFKFRSMHDGAEPHEPVWANVDDDRVTRVGRLIRKMRFDEIPQLLNVLTGDMSVVGPRPERPYFVEKLKEKIPYYSQRNIVKPGMTGWAQIRFRYGASSEDSLEKLKYDLYYIKNMSPFLDLAITFETTKILLLQKGAR